MTGLEKVKNVCLKKENEKLKEEIKRLKNERYEYLGITGGEDGQKTTIQDLLDEMKRQGRNSISFNFTTLQECFGGGNSYWFTKNKIEEEKDKTISVSDWLEKIGESCKGCYEESGWTDYISIKNKILS